MVSPWGSPPHPALNPGVSGAGSLSHPDRVCDPGQMSLAHIPVIQGKDRGCSRGRGLRLGTLTGQLDNRSSSCWDS